jgi:hypothetical protein
VCWCDLVCAQARNVVVCGTVFLSGSSLAFPGAQMCSCKELRPGTSLYSPSGVDSEKVFLLAHKVSPQPLQQAP